MTKRLASSPNAEYLVSLVGCPHTLTFLRAYLPDPGEGVYCMRCLEYRVVLEHIGMYKSHCNKCRFARSYGAARLTAQRKADHHARDYPGHEVTVHLGTTLVSVHALYGTQVELPYETGT